MRFADRRGRGMRRYWWLVGLAGLVMASTASLAFDQQAAPAPGSAAGTGEAVPGSAGLATPDPEPHREKGSEIRVPGLGVIGVLPKMDFGLELLYGANDQRGLTSGVPEIEKSEPGELAVKGRVMRRF